MQKWPMIFKEECNFRHQEHNRSKNTKEIAGEWVIESSGTAIAFIIFRESILLSHSIDNFSSFGGSFLVELFFCKVQILKSKNFISSSTPFKNFRFDVKHTQLAQKMLNGN